MKSLIFPFKSALAFMRQTLIININGAPPKEEEEKVFFVLAVEQKEHFVAPNNKDNKTHRSDKKEY
jgi:hypothetical protein